jgi:uncharacterized protein
MLLRLCSIALLTALSAAAQRQILFVTHSAGFRHDSIPVAARALETIGRRTGAFSVTVTEDLSRLSASGLAPFDAVFFFTSGELALSDSQKRDLLAFVRSGKGFGGAHSATDTLYSWAEYGDLIGAYFDGHPWVQEVAIDIEDPDFPGQRGQAPAYRIVEEIYQFREFSRDRVRVLQTLDTATVNLRAPGVNRTDNDFALSWCRPYGAGRVFYTALGHFDHTWEDARFQQMLEGALRWLVGEVPGVNAAPRTTAPQVAASGVTALSPGSLFRLEGTGLTGGGTLRAPFTPLPRKLAGTRVEVNGRAVPLVAVAPGLVEAQLPWDLSPGTAALTVIAANQASAPAVVTIAAATPVISSAAVRANVAVIYATGLGAVTPAVGDGEAAPRSPLSLVREPCLVLANGSVVTPFFAGLAPGLVGLFQVNAVLPQPAPEVAQLAVECGGVQSNRVTVIPDNQTGSSADSAPLP